jgi:tetratricopeptide (TPR) repeat protein
MYPKKAVFYHFRYQIENYFLYKCVNNMHQHAPINVDVLQQQGELKHALKDHEGALQDLEEAHQLDPFSGDILQQQREVKRILQDLISVLQDLGKVHQLGPSNVCILQQ